MKIILYNQDEVIEICLKAGDVLECLATQEVKDALKLCPTHWKFEEWRPRIEAPINYSGPLTKKRYVG